MRLYLDLSRYAELERLARERGVAIPQLLKRLVGDWLEGRLCGNSEA
ncbi:hypothetical protein [Pyrolobus fumarii]|nr:hypothetical protein [Pyrolobus fumarii]